LYGGSPGKANQCVGIEEKPENNLPTHFILEQNFPNPFNSRTQIKYAIPRPGQISLSLYDVLGREVLQIKENQVRPAGRYNIELNGDDWSGGIYLYQLQFIDESGFTAYKTRKMVVIK
jgi:hypothetical protein